ncbi:hypothetical protein PDPUS_2_00411 [Photobacterium damselae subsp. piscicida]|uniref:Uncharacterized protein n=2 Tax=Photobacterium damselae TaxID=38293 RepID=A0A1V1V8Q7_PHODP|nr:hypothetical protein [Photobacterium damselae]MBE8126903.1 hypothetical protein [Photobacterium damselae subsp. piscicida]MBE8130086.1 hypothetical protein [Photobacterium damselae subsp. piscicida]PSV64902.1 hypothetical protein CTT35_14165 [Photobacterium damselae]PSW77314.1 hypothetical protein CTT37_11195 [Photobacterium damselae]QOD52269.1 hypothetical protein IC628_12810 [Photobacterium damselae subsp. piscicida]
MKKKYDIPVKITEDFKPEESFEDYMKRWPQDLVFPECVIRHWIYEVQFVAEALRQRTDLSKWTFHKESFTKDQIKSIKHYDWHEAKMYEKALFWLKNGRHSAPPVMDFLIENGTFPVPIIVARNASSYSHPIFLYEERVSQKEVMIEPYHLIEGNKRWAILLALMETRPEKVKDKHDVWILSMD